MTSMGYGDAVPITVLGRIMAAAVAVMGIGMFALPAGILGGAFLEEVQRKRERRRKCPHCGRELTEPH